MERLPVIRRKLRPPPPPPTVVPRPSLLERLEDGRDARSRLTLVCGGPGYGKSTAVSAYAQNQELPTLWYALDPQDGDLATFLRYLVAGLELMGGEQTDDMWGLLATAPSPQQVMPTLIGLFVEAIEELGDSLIVLDDFHLVENSPGVLEVVRQLIEYLPEACQLVLISRSLPQELPLGLLRVRQALVEIGVAQLRFSKEELSLLYKALTGQEIAPGALNNWLSRTEGWVASLILVAGSGVGLPLDTDPSALFDYLAMEVFESLPPDLQRFMMRAAFLPAIDEAMLESVFDDAREMLNEARRRNLFLTPAPDGGFQLHPIWEAFLRNEAIKRLPPEDVKGLWVEGARLYRDKEPAWALKAYLQARDYDDAVMVADQWIQGLLEGNQVDAAEGVLFEFPEKVRLESPRLRLWTGEIDRLRGQLETALEHFEKAAEDPAIKGRALARQAAIWGIRGDSRDRELAEESLGYLQGDWSGRAFSLNVLGLHYLVANQLSDAERCFRDALTAYRKAQESVGQSKVLHNLGLVLARYGRLDQALETYQESIARAEEAGRFGHPFTYNSIASIRNYLNQFSEAQQACEQGLDLARRLGFQREESHLIWTLGMVSVHQGDFSQAAVRFRSARELAAAVGDKQLESHCLQGEAEIARRKHDYREAKRLIDLSIEQRGLPEHNPALLDLVMERAIIYAEADDKGALKQLESLREKLEKWDYRWRLAKVTVALAKYLEPRDPERAEKYRQDVRSLCAQMGYPNLLDETPVEAAPLTRAIEVQLFGEFAVKVDDKPVPSQAWLGFKTKMILALLLGNPEGITKEKLAETLYPDTDISRSAILTLINRLRQALEPGLSRQTSSRFVLWQGGKYKFNWAVSHQVDTLEFEAAIQQARQSRGEERNQAFQRALEVYKGTYLPEFSGEIWCQIAQEHYRRMWQSALHTLMEEAEKQGRWDQLLQLADRQLSVDRAAEGAHRAKMRALHKMGQRDGALRHYKIVEQVMREELGVEPEDETTRLYQNIAGGV